MNAGIFNGDTGVGLELDGGLIAKKPKASIQGSNL